MWLSKFSSLSSRTNPTVPSLLHEPRAHAGLVPMRRLDAPAYVYGLGLTAAHVFVDLFSMPQAIGQNGVNVRKAQRLVGLDDRLGSGPRLKRLYHNLQQYMGVGYPQNTRWILSKGDGHWLDRRHAGR